MAVQLELHVETFEPDRWPKSRQTIRRGDQKAGKAVAILADEEVAAFRCSAYVLWVTISGFLMRTDDRQR
jgi:hypothetical protein